MADAILCDRCGGVAVPNKAMHIRVHYLSSATTYNTGCKERYDLCNDCYTKLRKFMKGDFNVDAGHTEATN